MSWGSSSLYLCVNTVLCLQLQNSLGGLGLGRDTNSFGPHVGQLPCVQFRGIVGVGVWGWNRDRCTGFRSLVNCQIVARWRVREGGGLAVFLKGRHSRNTTMLASGPHVPYHRLGRGGVWARAASAGWWQRVGLHQFGFGSLCILPEMRIWLYDFTEFPKQIK